MAEAAIAAFNATKEQKYREIALDSFEWFFGKNLTGEVLYNYETHGIFDGIAANTINENQGAESTLAFLQSLLELRLEENILMTLEARS